MAGYNSKSRYEMMAKDRAQYLQRARHNALLTLPALMPMDGRNRDAHLIEPYQGLGAAGVVHLSSRMTIGLLPAGRPFMRLDLPPEVILKQGGDVPSDVTIGLSKAEQLVQAEVENASWRKSTLMSIQQLLVCGNLVEYFMPDNTIRCYKLDQFVQRFDSMNKLVELVIQEKFPRSAAPPGLKLPSGNMEKEDELELYTHIMRETGKNGVTYRRHIEWGNGESPMGDTIYPEADLPYISLGWAHHPGEDYARSKVEEHIADLRSLDALEKAQLEMAGMASRNFIMVRPGAQSASIKRRLTQAINGDVLVGDPESIELKSFDNAHGYQLTQGQVQVLRESLARAFLLMSGGQRNAERVTATEIERDIAELEAALGGVFSSLAQEMMKRRTELLMRNMKRQGKLPPFPEGMVVPTILTGLEALSRERDVSRAMQAAQIVQAFGPEAIDVVKLDKVLSRAFVGLGIPDAVRGEEEVNAIKQQRQEAQQQQAAMEKLGPEVVRQIGNAANQGE